MRPAHRSRTHEYRCGEPSLTARAFLPLISGLRRLGHHSASLLVAVGVVPATLDDPDARVPTSAGVRLLALAAETTSDECIGLHLAESADLRSIRATVGDGPGRSRPPLRTPGNRAPRRCPHAAAKTIGLSQLGLVTQAWARVIRTQRIARTEVIANASLRPISGFALRRAQSRPGSARSVAALVTNSPSPTHQSPIHQC